jgi:hypothetical protein
LLHVPVNAAHAALDLSPLMTAILLFQSLNSSHTSDPLVPYARL